MSIIDNQVKGGMGVYRRRHLMISRPVREWCSTTCYQIFHHPLNIHTTKQQNQDMACKTLQMRTNYLTKSESSTTCYQIFRHPPNIHRSTQPNIKTTTKSRDSSRKHSNGTCYSIIHDCGKIV